jgi:integrase
MIPRCPMKWIQRQLGHTSIRTMIDLYGHLLPEVGLDGVQELGALLF